MYLIIDVEATCWQCGHSLYDQNEINCHYHRIAYPFGVHRNVKAEFARRHHIRSVGVVQALRILGIRFEGTVHRGIDDARNIAKMFGHLMTVDGRLQFC